MRCLCVCDLLAQECFSLRGGSCQQSEPEAGPGPCWLSAGWDTWRRRTAPWSAYLSVWCLPEPCRKEQTVSRRVLSDHKCPMSVHHKWAALLALDCISTCPVTTCDHISVSCSILSKQTLFPVAKPKCIVVFNLVYCQSKEGEKS